MLELSATILQFPTSSDKPSVPTSEDAEQVKSPTKERIDYQDDLRMGNFKYLLDKGEVICYTAHAA